MKLGTSRTPPASAAPRAAQPPPQPDPFRVAQRAAATFWSTRGDEGIAELAEACRALSVAQLKLLGAWIPQGNEGSATATKCNRARTVVAGVLAEK